MNYGIQPTASTKPAARPLKNRKPYRSFKLYFGMYTFISGGMIDPDMPRKKITNIATIGIVVPSLVSSSDGVPAPACNKYRHIYLFFL
jgi:hypothetical protein